MIKKKMYLSGILPIDNEWEIPPSEVIAPSQKLVKDYVDDKTCHNKGLFQTIDELVLVYPIGVTGDYALIGNTNTFWSWDSGTSAWKNTNISPSALWGFISGSLDNQTDLKNVLLLKVDKVTGKVLSSNDYTTLEKNKLNGIEVGANKYTHPVAHPPAIITQDISNRFVTDTEKGVWNGKQDNLEDVTSVGIGREPVSNMVEISAEDTEDSNYIAIVSETDRTRGFSIDDENGYKWACYVYEEEDGDTLYIASGNSQRDVMCLQSGGRVGINVPTLLADVQILRIVQSGGNTYATVTTETPHRLPNNTPIKIVGATNAKFNGEFTITNVTTNGFRISGLEVGAVTEDPSDAEVVMTTNIPAAFAVFPQCFDAVYSFDKALDTGVGTGFVNLTANMKTSFGTPDTILPLTSGSYLYLGKAYPWRATNLDITTPSVGSSAIVVEYYNTSGGWTALTTSPTSGNSLVDSTNRLRNDGIISWNLTSFKQLWGHTPMVVNPTPKSTQDLYWIRISLTGTITTAPTSKSIGNHGVDRLAVFAQSGDVNPFFSVDQYGRVGITPAELEAKYSIGSLVGLTTSKFEIVSEDGYKSDFVYYLANSSSDMHPAVVMARSGGTIASKSAVINGMDLGAVYGFAYDGSQFREVAGMKFESASAGSAGNVAGRIVFFTRPGLTASVEVVRITEAGQMGIGTTAPRSKLDVNGGIRMGNDTDSAGINKVGTVRYRVDGSASICEMCMQTGASSYEWVEIKRNTW